MKARRYCPTSPTNFHRCDITNDPERIRGRCLDCGVDLRKGVDGAWYELLVPTWFLLALAFVVIAAGLALGIAWSWAS